MGLGVVCDMLGKFALAEQYHRRVKTLLPRISNPVVVGHCYLGLAIHEDFAGHWNEQRSCQMLSATGRL